MSDFREITAIRDDDGNVLGSVGYTLDTVYWSGGTWLSAASSRPSHLQAHRTEAEATRWVREQHALYVAGKRL